LIKFVFGEELKEYKGIITLQWASNIEESTNFQKRNSFGRNVLFHIKIEKLRTETFNFAELPAFNNDYSLQAENLKDLFTG